MNKRKLTIILLSPILLIAGVIALLIGFAYISGSDPALTFSRSLDANANVQRLLQLLVRCVLVPFQLIFIGLILAASLAIYRRRWAISGRIFGPLGAGEPSQGVPRDSDPTLGQADQLLKVRPQRQLTLTHIGASIISVTVILSAGILITGQFANLTSLAIGVTALTSALAWGARLPVSDVLGGISNIVEDNFSVGDQLAYRQYKLRVEGTVEHVDLRFTWLRAKSGELITIPFGEIRTLRNFSRRTFAGVYVSFPVPSDVIGPAIQNLEALAPQSVALIPDLLEPWHVVSQDGVLGSSVELSLYGRATVGREQELQLAMHELVWQKLQVFDIQPNDEGRP